MSVPEITTVVALDGGHIGEFRSTWPTWRRHKPQLADSPMLLILDTQTEPPGGYYLPADLPEHKIVFWPGLPDRPQRERMLTALTLLPGHYVETPWYVKIDTDTVAVDDGPWLPKHPDAVFYASPWGYTKPGQFILDLEAWGNSHPFLGKLPELGIRVAHPQKRCRHRRVISYVMLVDTGWSREAAGLAGDSLPVPSQDTFLWYVAQRTGKSWVRWQFKDMGFRHRGGALREAKRGGWGPEIAEPVGFHATAALGSCRTPGPLGSILLKRGRDHGSFSGAGHRT